MLVVVTAITALQLTLITVGNITDYETNHAFVTHVLAMDTTFRSPHMTWRAITSPGLVTAAYVAIIAWEALTALVLLVALVLSLGALRPSRSAQAARAWTTGGLLMMIALFGGAFIAIGGEYFQMWQSQKWNGVPSALQYLTIAGLFLILARLPHHEATEPAAQH